MSLTDGEVTSSFNPNCQDLLLVKVSTGKILSALEIGKWTVSAIILGESSMQCATEVNFDFKAFPKKNWKTRVKFHQNLIKPFEFNKETKKCLQSAWMINIVIRDVS